MSRPVVRPQWQLAALAAQRRDNELRKAEELKKIANYFEANTNKSRHHEQWTTEGYYEKANKEAVELSERKIRAAQLEERRKKLELMLFQENMQYQQELKTLGAQPKYYKNGSYLNKVPTSTLQEINQGIMAKEEQLRRHEAELRLHHAWRLRQPELRAASSYIAAGKCKSACCYLNKVPTSTLQEINQGIMAKEEQLRRHEAELRLHHAWRLRQPELRAASSYIAAGKCKSAWLEQIVEKEMEKKKEEEENIKIMQERDEALRRQIQIEEERLRDKERQMRELREGLEGQITEFSEKESIVNKLRKAEEREKMLLDELQFISSEREKEHARLVAERDANIVNMGLHKYKLKRKVISVLKEIELDLDMLAKIRRAVVKDLEKEQEKSASYKRVLDTALRELEEYKDKERQRQKNIEAMYDGEARQINEKQDKLWAKEREARSMLMNEVISTLRRQLEEKIEVNRQQQKENVLEREKILEDMDGFHQEVRSRERETQLKNATYSTMASLQSQLNSLRVQQQQAAAASEREAARREACARERRLRHEIARAQRTHSAELNSLRVQQQQAAAASEREAARREACARERRLRHEIARAQRTHSAEAWT